MIASEYIFYTHLALPIAARAGRQPFVQLNLSIESTAQTAGLAGLQQIGPRSLFKVGASTRYNQSKAKRTPIPATLLSECANYPLLD